MDQSTIVIAIIVGQICWLVTLSSFLGNKEIEPTERIIWTIVLCTLNIVGMFLYLFHKAVANSSEYATTPQADSNDRQDHKTTCGVMSDSELKDYFNSKS